jgi:hypothetical protein
MSPIKIAKDNDTKDEKALAGSSLLLDSINPLSTSFCP